MGRTVAILTAMLFLLTAGEVLAAGRLRWITSIYADGQGIGMKNPEGVACGGSHIAVADTGNSRVLIYRYQDETVTPGATLAFPKSSPIVVQLNSRGDLYFLDSRERRISQVSPSGESRSFFTPKSLPSAGEIVPKSFKIGPDDDLYVLDIFSERVLVLDSQGRYLRQIAFPESFGFISDLAVDREGRVFLVDSVDAAVFAAEKDAERFSRLSESLKEYMNFPTSLAVDSKGLLYLVDQHGGGVAVLGQDGSFQGRRLGMGWNESRLYFPSQICIGQAGEVLIADRNNSRVQLFTLAEK